MNRRKWLATGTAALSGLSLLPFKGLSLPAPAAAPPLPSDEEVILCFNENPYGPCEAARKAMADTIRVSNRYPWALIHDLMSAIAARHQVTADNTWIGAGSTEILDLLAQRAEQQKGSFVVATPSFDRWGTQAVACGLRKIAVPLTTDKVHDLDAMLAAIEPGTRMVYVCNPNNPTGTVCNHEGLVSFVQKATAKTTVVVDEAYLDYAGEPSLIPLAVKNDNLVVVKTFSKIYGLAGARAGYAIATAGTIDALNNLRSGADMGISAVSIAAALASLKDETFVSSSRDKNDMARAFTMAQLGELGLRTIPSRTNFIYISLQNYKGDFFKRLTDHNIKGTGIFEEDGKWTRITVGTMQEMERFILAIS